MKLSLAILLSSLSLSVFAKTPLLTFSSLFNDAECVDTISVKNTKIQPSRFLFKKYFKAKQESEGNQSVSISYARSKKTEYFTNIKHSFEAGTQGYCMNPSKAIDGFNYLVSYFDHIEGIIMIDKDTEDDDSTTNFTIIMKDGSYADIYFGN